MNRPWQARPEGLRLFIRLTPKSSRDALESVEVLSDGQCVLKARVRAVPEDGKANAAVIALLAKQLKTPASRIKLASGATSRAKSFDIEGDASALSARLEEIAAKAAP